MSTKIYNGLKFTTKDVTKIYNALIELRPEAIRIGTEIKCETIVHTIVSILDRYVAWNHYNFPLKNEDYGINPKTGLIHNIVKDRSLLSEQIWDFLDKVQSSQRSVRDDYDIKLQVMIHPIKRKALGTEYCSDSQLRKLLFTCPLVEEYHYQNQCDQPENISNYRWETRRKDWDLALPGMGIPLYNGLEVTILDYKLLELRTSNEDLIKAIPSIHKRIKMLSNELGLKHFMEIFGNITMFFEN